MSKVEIHLFGRLRIISNNQELPLSTDLKEFIALLAAVGGEKVTAKSCWKVLKEPTGCKFSSIYFSRYLKELQAEMDFFKTGEFVEISMLPLRYCRIVQPHVVCDYYRMLNGELAFGEEEDFLPEYKWARNFYHRKWVNLFDAWQQKFE